MTYTVDWMIDTDPQQLETDGADYDGNQEQEQTEGSATDSDADFGSADAS